MLPGKQEIMHRKVRIPDSLYQHKQFKPPCQDKIITPCLNSELQCIRQKKQTLPEGPGFQVLQGKTCGAALLFHPLSALMASIGYPHGAEEAAGRKQA